MTVAFSSSLEGKALRRSVVRMNAHLLALDRARRHAHVLRAVADRVFWGVLLGCLILGAGHFVQSLHRPVTVVGTVLVCTVIVVVRAWGRRRAVNDVALWVDAQADLDERVSSALAFLDADERTPMMRETVSDAERRLHGIQADDITGPPPSRRWVAVPVLFFLLLALALIPPRLTDAELKNAALMQNVRSAGENLSDTAESLQEQMGADATPDARAAVEQAQQAGDALQEDTLQSQEQAMEQLERAQQAVDGALRDDVERELLGERLQQNASTRSAGEALSRGDTHEAAEALRDAADKLSERDVGGEAGQTLADDLRSAAAGMQPGPAQAAANRAAAGAEQGRLDAAQEGLRDLADEVENMSSLGNNRAQVEQAANALQRAREEVSDAAMANQQGEHGQPGGESAGNDGAPGAATPNGEGESGTPGGEQSAEGGSPAGPGPEQGGAPSAEGEAGMSGGTTGAGIGAGTLQRGEGMLTMDAGARVELVGELLAGERKDGTRRAGPRVADDGSPDLGQAVQQVRDVGEAEIARQEIPPGYRALVRDYFTELEAVASGEAHDRE